MASTTPTPALPSAVEYVLHLPPLQELADALHRILGSNFEHVSVNVTEAPDLTAAPWHLSASGLCGNPRLIGTCTTISATGINELNLTGRVVWVVVE
jgi:hypothetical protein